MVYFQISFNTEIIVVMLPSLFISTTELKYKCSENEHHIRYSTLKVNGICFYSVLANSPIQCGS